MQDRQQFGSNQHFDAASDARLPSNQPRSLQGEDHLVNRRRADAEVTLQVGFRRRPSQHARIGVDEG
jgi:hypothetical protein